MDDPSDFPLLVIVDDEQEILTAIRRCLMRSNVNIESFTSPRLALAFIEKNEPSMVISDQRMPDILGIELLKLVKKRWPQTKRIMLSAFQEFDLVLDGFNEGVIDKFISKPWKNVELQYLVEDADKTSVVSRAATNLQTPFIGTHPLMELLLDNIAKAAGANVPIFIHGETGTGKELVASACHELGCKRGGDFIAVNCANFSEQLIESQLFGHKKGAFTGATADQKGVFDHANGGTVFLDEITTLPVNLQSKLLRVIQERVYSPLGSVELKAFDAQIVSASSTSLADAVNTGSFRQDLYYRLNVIPISIPPLRAREQDIFELACHFLAKFSEEYQKEFTQFSEESNQFISSYSWPGNVRQLENVIHGICVLNNAKTVDISMIQPLIDDSVSVVNIEVEQPSHVDFVTQKSKNIEPRSIGIEDGIEPLHAVEKRAIEQAIERCDGNVNKAAALLEVNPSTLYRKIKSWGS